MTRSSRPTASRSTSTPTSVQYVGGAQIDYVDSLYGSGFSINNPNSKGSCGCGHSFQA